MLRSAKRSSLPSLTSSSSACQDLRASKVLELKTRCPGLKERIRGSEFSLSFSCTGIDYELVIDLPQSFPFESPVLRVHPHAIHPLLDESSVVCGLPDLTAFSIHASLPDIVHHVLEQFIVTPLVFRKEEIAIAELPRKDKSAFSSKMLLNGIDPQSSPLYREINSMSVADLRDWSSDDSKIVEFVGSLPHVRARKDNLKGMAEANEILAQSNLSLKESLEVKRVEILSHCEALAQERCKHETLQKNFSLLAKNYSPEALQLSLAKKAQETEEQSDYVAERFLASEIGVHDFLKSFMEMRFRSHERAAKAERLHLQLEALHRAGF